MKRYEYDYLIFDDLHTKEVIDECNEMGKEGWELVSHSIYCDSAGIEGHNVWHYYYFKREIL